MENKTIYTIDMVLVGLGVVLLLGLIGYSTPRVIAPIDNLTTADSFVLFSIDNANSIFIDDNINFSSPEEIIVEDNIKINLEPGFYYWKIKSVGRSEIRTLNILSEVDFRIKKSENGYDITNAGNVNLNVEVYDNNTKVGNFDLAVDEAKESNGDKFIGGQNE